MKSFKITPAAYKDEDMRHTCTTLTRQVRHTCTTLTRQVSERRSDHSYGTDSGLHNRINRINRTNRINVSTLSGAQNGAFVDDFRTNFAPDSKTDEVNNYIVTKF